MQCIVYIIIQLVLFFYQQILETYLSFAGIAMVNSGKYDEILTKTKQLEVYIQ